jgi:hypothetical protein
MTLDVTKIASQIEEMVLKIKSGSQERQEHLKHARDKLNDSNVNLEKLKRKIASAKTPNWSPAGLYDGINQHYPAPPVPAEYSALATDGSHIDVDRHKAAHCYLINIGAVALHYGLNPMAELVSEPHLYSEEKDLVIKNGTNKRQEQQIRGDLLDAKRSVEECRKLAAMAAALPENRFALALMDGSLVMFGMQNYPDFVIKELLNRGLINALDEIKELSSTRRLVLASYISLPQSDDVVNVLRIAICPQENVDCERSCGNSNSACDIVSGVNDRALFGRLLKEGERSATFINPSRIIEKYYGQHKVYFFYLQVEDEIARVEIPEWVAMRDDLISLTHALVLDQCRRGQGYPVALSEAHEEAVVTGADREEFWGIVEEALVEEKLPTYTSIKSRSKRTRWI